MRVLVDTSVWSLALRKKGPTDHPSVRALSSLLLAGEDVFLVGLVLQEVLQAFRSEKQFQTIAMTWSRSLSCRSSDRTSSPRRAFTVDAPRRA